MPNPVLIARAKVARNSHSDNPVALNDARRELTEAKLERHIREVVAAAPPLTQEQRDRLAALLSAGAA